MTSSVFITTVTHLRYSGITLTYLGCLQLMERTTGLLSKMENLILYQNSGVHLWIKLMISFTGPSSVVTVYVYRILPMHGKAIALIPVIIGTTIPNDCTHTLFEISLLL